MTESCSCITAHPPDKYDYKYAHAVATIITSTEVKIVDLDGTELGLNQPGEVGSQPQYLYSQSKSLRRTHFVGPSPRPPNRHGVPQ